MLAQDWWSWFDGIQLANSHWTGQFAPSQAKPTHSSTGSGFEPAQMEPEPMHRVTNLGLSPETTGGRTFVGQCWLQLYLGFGGKWVMLKLGWVPLLVHVVLVFWTRKAETLYHPKTPSALIWAFPQVADSGSSFRQTNNYIITSKLAILKLVRCEPLEHGISRTYCDRTMPKARDSTTNHKRHMLFTCLCEII